MSRKIDRSRPPTPETWVTSKRCDRKIENAETAARKKIMGSLHPQSRKQAPRRKGSAITRASSDKESLGHGKECYPLLYWYCDPSQPIDR